MAKTTGTLNLHIVDSTRQPFQGTALVTLRDGNGRQLHRNHHDANIITFQIELADNLRDLYTVNVAADNSQDAGFTPVHVTADGPEDVYLMLTRKKPRFQFLPTFADIFPLRPNVHQILERSGLDEVAYQRLAKFDPDHPERCPLATLLNILTALDDIPVRTPGPLEPTNDSVLSFYYQSVFLDRLKDDRFFAKADSRLKPFLEENSSVFAPAGAGLHDAKEFAEEVADVKPLGSLKQTLFLESNVQFVFYKGRVEGTDVVENDVDYFADLAAHLFLEVIPNGVSKKLGHPMLTDPRHAYVMRWTQSKNIRSWRQAPTSIVEFNPPLALV